jgi:RimJ/RimL family protein N-acetyltransferase
MTEVARSTVVLRPVEDADLEALFEHQRDPISVAMAAFPAREREAFLAHWAKIRANPDNIIRTVVVDGSVAGNVGSWPAAAHQEIGYWFDRAYWGRGVATAAVREFLQVVPTRPLHAIVAVHNVGSIRVLEKCGFQRVEADRPIAADGIEEVELVLDA